MPSIYQGPWLDHMTTWTWPADAANMKYYVTTPERGVCVCCTNVCGPRKISSLHNRKWSFVFGCPPPLLFLVKYPTIAEHILTLTHSFKLL